MAQNLVYLNAAESIANEKYESTCQAVFESYMWLFPHEWPDAVRARILYTAYFHPVADENNQNILWPGLHYGRKINKSKNQRILMLLFMHEIANDNGE